MITQNIIQDIYKLKCKQCKQKTKHKICGFERYNRRYECLECGYEVEDFWNER